MEERGSQLQKKKQQRYEKRCGSRLNWRGFKTIRTSGDVLLDQGKEGKVGSKREEEPSEKTNFLL